MESRERIALLTMLLDRLERIPADSRWAHRASGIRGALLEAQERFEAGRAVSWQSAIQLMERGFWLLQKAAEEKRGGAALPNPPPERKGPAPR